MRNIVFKMIVFVLLSCAIFAGDVFVNNDCVGCGACTSVCPVGAIGMKDGKAIIDKDKCIKCLLCIKACPVGAIHQKEKQVQKNEIQTTEKFANQNDLSFYNVVKTRRAIRAYSDKEISEELIKNVFDVALSAPSARNRQPWRFLVVQKQKDKDFIQSLVLSKWVSKAPIHIICMAEPYEEASHWLGSDLSLVDLSLAIDHLTLSARNFGLGTCYICGGINYLNEKKIKQYFDIPDNRKILCIITMGYPLNGEKDFIDNTKERRNSFEKSVEFFESPAEK